MAHARRRRRIGRGHVIGGHVVHADAREGTTWLDRLAIGGPWLGIGGGNANALPHPTI